MNAPKGAFLFSGLLQTPLQNRTENKNEVSAASTIIWVDNPLLGINAVNPSLSAFAFRSFVLKTKEGFFQLS